jgi:hypothetical protein
MPTEKPATSISKSPVVTKGSRGSGNMTDGIALVTGANKGIGFEIARQLGKRGMTVFMGRATKSEGPQPRRSFTAREL